MARQRKEADGGVLVNFGNKEIYSEQLVFDEVTGVGTFKAFPITPSSAPTTNYQVSNKKYVDDAIAGVSQFTDEKAQDAVGNILLDSASVNFTYDDATPNITAAVLPAGVAHDSLSGVHQNVNTTASPTFANVTATATIQAEQLTSTDDINLSGAIFSVGNMDIYPNNQGTVALRIYQTGGNTVHIQGLASTPIYFEDNVDLNANNLTTTGSITATSFVIGANTLTTSEFAYLDGVNGYIYRAGGTDVPLADGGTGASLVDPNANNLMGWDDTDGAIKFITIGTNLSYDHATHTLSGSAAGANTALSNLAAVAINTSLISDTANTDDLGTQAIPWKDVNANRIIGQKYSRMKVAQLAAMHRLHNATLSIGNGFLIGFTNVGGATERDYLSDYYTGTWSGSPTTAQVEYIGEIPSLNFDGTDDFLTINNSGDWSIAGDSTTLIQNFIINVVDTAGVQTIAGEWDETTGLEAREWRLYLNADEKMVLDIFDENLNGYIRYTSDDALSVGWHHVIISYTLPSSEDFEAYLDGGDFPFTRTTSGSFTTVQNTGAPYLIGAKENSAGNKADFFAGNLAAYHRVADTNGLLVNRWYIDMAFSDYLGAG